MTVTCPYLGLESDPSLRFSYVDAGHRCHAFPQAEPIERDHQQRYCLAAAYVDCPRYLARLADARPQATSNPPAQAKTSRSAAWPRYLLWGVIVVLLIAAGAGLASILIRPAPASPAGAASPPAPSPTASDTPASAWPTPDPAYAAAAVTPAATAVRLPDEPPATPTLAPGDVLLRVTPAADAVGWVGSQESRGNHFGDSFLHTGVANGEIFHSALQFDISRLARGAPIRYAALILTGLEDERLDRSATGVWEARWLASGIDENWSRLNFQDIHNAPVVQSLLPPLGQANLGPLAVNVFEFSPDQLTLLQQAVVNEQTRLSLRLDGPQAGGDNLFTWDSGYGPATRGNAPALLIVAGPPPATPPPVPTRDFIVVTSTPTPENVLTAAAIVQTATALATQVGTPTPTPRTFVTATPTAANEATAQAERLAQGLPVVIIPTATPANAATATAIAIYETAVAVTTGTWTPTPQSALTATPTPTFVAVTNTPTPANAATALARAIAEATRTATAGPLPSLPPWVVTATPPWVVVTSTSTPQNQATRQAEQAMATIVALTTGAYTPTPANQATATWTPPPTPLPLLMPLPRLSPTATPTPPQPRLIPDSLRGKIVFVSDRLGEPRLFVMDAACAALPEGCANAEVLWLTQDYPYRLAQEVDVLAPGGQARLLVQPNDRQTPQVYVQDLAYNTTRGLTDLARAAYDPVWSPTGDLVAFVSTDPGNDEIYTISPEGSNVQRLTNNSWEWDKHPTWSPDGRQILFYSNRETGRRQLWIMSADGSGQRNISNNSYNDWDPVWIK